MALTQVQVALVWGLHLQGRPSPKCLPSLQGVELRGKGQDSGKGLSSQVLVLRSSP